MKNNYPDLIIEFKDFSNVVPTSMLVTGQEGWQSWWYGYEITIKSF